MSYFLGLFVLLLRVASEKIGQCKAKERGSCLSPEIVCWAWCERKNTPQIALFRGILPSKGFLNHFIQIYFIFSVNPNKKPCNTRIYRYEAIRACFRPENPPLALFLVAESLLHFQTGYFSPLEPRGY